MKDSKSIFKKLTLIGVGLCAACCIIPIVGVLFGMGALTFLAGLLKWAGIAAMIVALAFFGIYHFRGRRAQACKLDCACKDENEAIKNTD